MSVCELSGLLFPLSVAFSFNNFCKIQTSDHKRHRRSLFITVKNELFGGNQWERGERKLNTIEVHYMHV
jgi:hypothetical protein